ncbi:hypothetical protein AAG906_039342 [Vitis piasezkii]
MATAKIPNLRPHRIYLKTFEVDLDLQPIIQIIESLNERSGMVGSIWVLFGTFILFEILETTPLLQHIVFVVAYVYEHFVRSFFVNPRTINAWYVLRKKDIFNKPYDILTGMEKYIQEHGQDAFENIINKTDKKSKSRGSNHTIFYEDHGYRAF